MLESQQWHLQLTLLGELILGKNLCVSYHKYDILHILNTAMEYVSNQIASLLAAIFMALGSLWGQTTSLPIETNLLLGTTTAQVVQVIDGDTIEVMLGGSTARTKVRYIGIDTPEPYATNGPECGSKEATTRNRELVQNKTVTLVPGLDAYDDYGRILAYVYVEGVFINEALVQDGFATVMMIKPNTRYKASFETLYQKARAQQLGMWSMCE